MNTIPEEYAGRPNLWRLSQELAKFGDAAYPIADCMAAVAQTNNHRFNAMLNRCQNPRSVYDALTALAPIVEEVRT